MPSTKIEQRILSWTHNLAIKSIDPKIEMNVRSFFLYIQKKLSIYNG